MKTSVQLLETLTNAHAAPGFEDELRELFIQETASAGELSADRFGGLVRELGKEGPRVAIAGHMDEVGFQIQAITSDGFLRFLPLGGWWSHTLPSQEVIIRTGKGQKIHGLIATEPVHFLPESKRSQVVPIDAMFIDVGASSRSEVAEWGIEIGNPVVPATRFKAMPKKDLYLAKAFDNRVGMAGVIESLNHFKEHKHPNVLLGLATCQEELGLRGAKTLATLAKPDVAIVLEGPPADDLPGYPRDTAQGKLGAGVQIRLSDPSAMMNSRLVDFVKSVAEEHQIPHQLTVRRSGGTDAGSFSVAGTGIPSIVLGVPARYIHSHRSVIDYNDYLAMTTLVEKLVPLMDEKTVSEFTRYI